MASDQEINAHWIHEQIQKKAHNLFKAKSGKPQLQLFRLFEPAAEEDKCRYAEIQFIDNGPQLEALKTQVRHPNRMLWRI